MIIIFIEDANLRMTLAMTRHVQKARSAEFSLPVVLVDAFTLF